MLGSQKTVLALLEFWKHLMVHNILAFENYYKGAWKGRRGNLHIFVVVVEPSILGKRIWVGKHAPHPKSFEHAACPFAPFFDTRNQSGYFVNQLFCLLGCSSNFFLLDVVLWIIALSILERRCLISQAYPYNNNCIFLSPFMFPLITFKRVTLQIHFYALIMVLF